jgi:hypothetical protein
VKPKTAMTDLPNIVRQRLRAKRPENHPDPNLLSAFAEQSLRDRERTAVLEHLALCGDCRDIVALAAPPTESSVANDTGRGHRVSWFAWPVLRWGALAACLVIIGSAVLLRYKLNPPASYVMKDLAAPAPPQVASQPPAIASRDDEQRWAASLPSANREDALLAKKSDVGVPSPNTAARSLGAGSAPGTTAAGAQQAIRLHQKAGQNLLLERRTTLASDVSGAVPTVELRANETTAPPATEGRIDALRADAPGKAKAATVPAPAGIVNPAAPAPARVETPILGVVPGPANNKLAFLSRGDVSRWTISSDGQLQHSTDSGRTWQPVVVAEKATFRALSANGPDIWVGGAQGLLYHSTDAGGHWTQVKPAAGDFPLSVDIAAIEFTDPRHGKVTTAGGEVWLTADAGRTWHIQR